MKKIALCAAVAIVAAGLARADVVLDTDFQFALPSVAPSLSIQSITWASDVGEAANADTTLALTGSATGFLSVTAGTDGTGPAIGVSGNIETVGPWTGTFTFTPSQEIELSSFDISSYSISGGGSHQFGSDKTVNWAVNVSDGGGSVFSGSQQKVESGWQGGAYDHTKPEAFSIDMTGTTLAAGTAYTFDLTVSSPDSGGNNIALDTLTLHAIPEPATFGLMALFGGGVLFMRRRFLLY